MKVICDQKGTTEYCFPLTFRWCKPFKEGRRKTPEEVCGYKAVCPAATTIGRVVTLVKVEG
jgi:hypothetical protein